MKYVLAALFLFLSSGYFAQTLVPSNNMALINLTVVKNITVDDELWEAPVKAQITFISAKNNKEFICTTSVDGVGQVLLPVGDVYNIFLPEKVKYDKIEIPQKSNFTKEYKILIKSTDVKETNATIKLKVVTPEGKPLINEEVTVTGELNKKTFSGSTNQEGNIDFTVPINENYVLQYKNAPDYDLLEIPNVPGYILEYTSQFEGSASGTLHPSRTKSRFDLYYKDLKNNPVANESLFVKSTGGGEYSVITDKSGKAQLLVPIGDEYFFSSKYWINYAHKSIKSVPGRYINEIILIAPSSKEYEAREAEIIKKAAKADSLYKLFYENKATPEDILTLSTLTKHAVTPDDNIDLNVTEIEKIAVSYKENLKKDPQYFTKNNNVILAVFNRMKNNWLNNVIVMDVTGSMRVFAIELLCSEKMKIIAGTQNKYLFFNDGNDLKDSEKEIGKTGGIYYCENNKLEEIINTIKKAMSSLTKGGAIPENDIEALIMSQEKMSTNSELILIADNLSPVRDIQLIEKIKFPVRIILCGNTETIMEDYLEIAYKTKGSIHTLTDDIYNLHLKKDGEIWKWNNVNYKIVNGKFFLIK